jgi:hypothetical protein
VKIWENIGIGVCEVWEWRLLCGMEIWGYCRGKWRMGFMGDSARDWLMEQQRGNCLRTVCLSVCLPVCYLLVNQSINRSINQSINQYIYLSVRPSIIYLPTHPPTYIPTYLPNYLPAYLPIHIYLFIYLFTHRCKMLLLSLFHTAQLVQYIQGLNTSQSLQYVRQSVCYFGVEVLSYRFWVQLGSSFPSFFSYRNDISSLWVLCLLWISGFCLLLYWQGRQQN